MQELHTFRVAPAVFWTVALAATVVDIAAYCVLQFATLVPSTRIAVALAPLPGNLALIVLLLRIIRRFDEFQQRLQLEAVAIGFLSTAVALFIYGYLRKADAVAPLHPFLAYLFMFVMYGLGYAIAARHYR
jgi:hypothetical protein